MTEHLIHQSDFTTLDNYRLFLQKLPQSTRSFKVNLDLVPAREYGAYRIPEIEGLLGQASRHLSRWSLLLPAINTLYRELEDFVTGITAALGEPLDEHGIAPPLMPDVPERLGTFVDSLNDHEQTLQYLSKGIYTLVPRLIDFMNSNIYRHASQHHLMDNGPSGSAAKQRLTSSMRSDWSGPELSAQARLNAARRHARALQREYAEAYGAATNIGAYLSRMSDLCWTSLGHAMKALKADSSPRRELEIRLTLVDLKEIQRFRRQFNPSADSIA